ncbi:DUF821 domain-containing protein [Teratosphaeria destructans]|uniref:DUF821 domain-containing protein n=1 Tax=Teratosphaeria destructans TaxID=418781 RepID=A0A9W7W0C6_9PEZI|nr:DUF821 domain-containing protein [Teratosphaeria destructans]
MATHHMFQHQAFWKVVAALLVVCILVQQFGFSESPWPQHVASEFSGDTPKHKPPPSWRWHFDFRRDHNNYGLSDEQCDEAFPELYHEIDRAARQWRGRNITSESLELYGKNEAGVRVMLVDQQLRVLSTKGMHRQDFRQRILAVLHQIQRAITSVSGGVYPFDDMEFTIVVDDFVTLSPERNLALWSFARETANARQSDIWLIPDFNFWSAPPVAGSFSDMQARARAQDSPIADKIQKLLWRGVKWTAPKLRGALIDATAGRPWADVAAMDWRDPGKVVRLEDHCQYAYLVNTEGRSWSSRLLYILNCDSVPILHDMRWTAHYYHLLNGHDAEKANYVPVDREFSDLEAKISDLLDDPSHAQAIADNARQLFRERYTTPAATACYWRRLLRQWSSVAFTPEEYEEVAIDAHGGKRMRGVALEEFL